MTPAELQAIRERAAKATDSLPSISLDNLDELAYVASHDVLALLTEVERLEAIVRTQAEILADSGILP